jgi:hypothetical protein
MISTLVFYRSQHGKLFLPTTSNNRPPYRSSKPLSISSPQHPVHPRLIPLPIPLQPCQHIRIQPPIHPKKLESKSQRSSSGVYTSCNILANLSPSAAITYSRNSRKTLDTPTYN